MLPTIDDLEHPQFANLIKEFKPHQIVAIVSLLEKLADSFGEQKNNSTFSNVTELFLEGEAMAERQAKKLQDFAPNATLLPEYGLSESDIFTFYDPDIAKKLPEMRFRVFQLFSTTHVAVANPDKNGLCF